MKWKPLLLIAALMSGAAQADELGNVEQVGKLPDGRMVNLVVVKDRGFLQNNHYVYFIDRADVSNNYTVSTGKSSRNDVQTAFPDNPAMTKYFALIDAEIARLEAHQKELTRRQEELKRQLEQ